jgi:Cft2 family RNA processing exonuclease
MKFTIETIQSLPSDGASCHLLIFNKTIKILLDCGISHTFDFKKYIDRI